MASADLDPASVLDALAVIDDLIAAQRRRVLAHARRIRPALTEADLRRAQDFPDVFGDPGFQLEHGQLAALVAARLALESRVQGDALPA